MSVRLASSVVGLGAWVLVGCTRASPSDLAPPTAAPALAPSLRASASSDAVEAAGPARSASVRGLPLGPAAQGSDAAFRAGSAESAVPSSAPAAASSSGRVAAREIALSPGRPIYYALPRELAEGASSAGPKPWRLLGHLHGICGPPSYACGKWVGAAGDVGVLVCPTGNAKCGDSPYGPPSWEADSWDALVAAMDGDLEASIAKVAARHEGSIRREGAVLTGYSRGAYAAPVVARRHPGRWPYLVLIEANVSLTAEALRRSGVRAVALVAGEQGAELAGERRTASELAERGFPAKLVVMPKTGHLYSDDMERVMAEALSFVLSY